jgi:predicted transcriptional regulator
MIAYIPNASKSDLPMTAQDLAVPCEPLEPDTQAAKALERLRAQPIAALPVVAGGRVVGIVGEADLLRPLASGVGRGALRSATVDEVANRDVVSVDGRLSVEEAARLFAERGLKAVPVLDPFGAYAGMLRRSDVLAAYLGPQLPPPRSVAGLSTPLGVRLVCGRVSAGAGPPGLLLTGVVMAALLFAAKGIVGVLSWLVEVRWPQWPLFTMLISNNPRVNQLYFPYQQVWALGALGLYTLAFLVLMRLAPLTATHGAEHKVVHAIERGRPLTLEGVRPMPTVHPRCGTNLGAMLFAFFLGVMVLTESLPDIAHYFGPLAVAAALIAVAVAVLLARSVIGSWAQAWFTTREPGEHRLAAAIEVGEELLRRYREHPPERLSFAGRLWMLGLPLALVGMVATLAALFYLSEWLHLGIAY